MKLSYGHSRTKETTMRRKFVMTDIIEIMEDWYAGRSKEAVARSLGIDSKTVRKYVRPAVAEGIVPGGSPPV